MKDNRDFVIIVSLLIAGIIIGAFLNNVLTKPRITITDLEVEKEYEEGAYMFVKACNKVNFPTDSLSYSLSISPYYTSRECFEYDYFGDMDVSTVGNRWCESIDVRVRPDLPESCFGEHILTLRMDSMGVEVEEEVKFNIASSGSAYCKQCESECLK